MLEKELENTKQEMMENLDYIYLGHDDAVLNELEWGEDRYGEVMQYKKYMLSKYKNEQGLMLFYHEVRPSLLY